MHNLSLRFLTLLVFAASSASLSVAQEPNHEPLPFDVFIAPPQPIPGFDIRWTDLFGANGTAPDSHDVHGPFHGVLTATSEGFYYAAKPSLWETEVDSFVLDYRSSGEHRAINVVIAVGQAHKGESELNTFDYPGTGDPDWNLEDPAGVADIASSALWVEGATRDPAYVYFMVDDGYPELPRPDRYDSDKTHPGSSTTGSGTGVLLNPPPEGEARLEAGRSQEAVVVAAGPAGLADLVRARLHQSEAGLKVRLEAFDETGTLHESAWVDLSASVPSQLNVEYDHPSNGQETLRLWVDGGLGTDLEFEAGDLSHLLEEYRIGRMEVQGGAALTLEIQDAEVYQFSVHPDEEPRHTDDFEDGDLADWTSSSGSGLSIAEKSIGRNWLAADLADGDSFLVDATPASSTRTRLRFDLDPDLFDISAVKVLAIRNADGGSGASEYVRLRVKGWPLVIEALVKDGGSWRSTGWMALPTTRIYRVDLTLRSATWSNSDGWLRLRVNGVEVAEIDGLADSANRVETVHFGAMGVGAGRSGRIYLDNYQLWVPHVCTGGVCDQ